MKKPRQAPRFLPLFYFELKEFWRKIARFIDPEAGIKDIVRQLNADVHQFIAKKCVFDSFYFIFKNRHLTLLTECVNIRDLVFPALGSNLQALLFDLLKQPYMPSHFRPRQMGLLSGKMFLFESICDDLYSI